MNILIWFFAGAMTGVAFSRLAELAGNIFDAYRPPAAYLAILIGVIAAVAAGFAVNRGFSNYYIFSLEADDFDFPAVLAGLGSAVLALAVLYLLA